MPILDEFELSVRRSTEVTIIKMRSQLIEKIMKEFARGKDYSPYDMGDYSEHNVDVIKNLKAWNTPPIALPSGRRVWHNFSHGIYAMGFNMKYLSVCGLGEGLEFKFSEPFSKAQIKDLMEKAKESIEEFLTEHARPLEGSLKIKVERPAAL